MLFQLIAQNKQFFVWSKNLFTSILENNFGKIFRKGTIDFSRTRLQRMNRGRIYFIALDWSVRIGEYWSRQEPITQWVPGLVHFLTGLLTEPHKPVITSDLPGHLRVRCRRKKKKTLFNFLCYMTIICRGRYNLFVPYHHNLCEESFC